MTAATILPLRPEPLPLEGEPMTRPLSLEEIDAEVAAIRRELSSPLLRLARLREAGAHLTAGFATWHEAVAAWLGDLRTLRLSGSAEARQEREALIHSIRATGASTRAIREQLGVSSDAVATALRERDPAPERIVGADGRARAAQTGRQQRPELPAPEGRVWQQAAEWLRRATEGELPKHEGGLTLRELAALAGWSEGKASGALSDLLRRCLAERLEDRRGGYRLHRLRLEPAE